MIVCFADKVWEDYQHWVQNDKKYSSESILFCKILKEILMTQMASENLNGLKRIIKDTCQDE